MKDLEKLKIELNQRMKIIEESLKFIDKIEEIQNLENFKNEKLISDLFEILDESFLKRI